MSRDATPCQKCNRQPAYDHDRYGHWLSHTCRDGSGVTCCFPTKAESVAAWDKSQQSEVDVCRCWYCEQWPFYVHDSHGHSYAHVCTGIDGYGGVFNWPTRVAAAGAWNKFKGKQQR